MIVKVIVDGLQLYQHSTFFFYPFLEFVHKLCANTLILKFGWYNDLNQIISKSIIILLKISYCKAYNWFVLFQNQTIWIFTAPHLMNPFVCSFDCPFSIFFVVIIFNIQRYNLFNIQTFRQILIYQSHYNSLWLFLQHLNWLR